MPPQRRRRSGRARGRAPPASSPRASSMQAPRLERSALAGVAAPRVAAARARAARPRALRRRAPPSRASASARWRGRRRRAHSAARRAVRAARRGGDHVRNCEPAPASSPRAATERELAAADGEHLVELQQTLAKLRDEIRASPERCDKARWRRQSPVAQLAEHPAVNRRVVGSSPTRGATALLAMPRDWSLAMPPRPISRTDERRLLLLERDRRRKRRTAGPGPTRISLPGLKVTSRPASPSTSIGVEQLVRCAGLRRCRRRR